MVQETTVEPGCGAGSYPLSPMQQGMLFHRLGAGTAGTDLEQVVCTLPHPVSLPEFERAWRLMVQRHDSLRTSFAWREDQEARQWVRPPEQVDLPVRVLTPAGVESARAEIESYLAADRRAGFSTLEAPLVRVALFNGARACFVFTYHHLVLDARGMHTLFREVLDVYDAFISGGQAQLPPVTPYREYIAWLQTLDLHRAEAFWRDHLGSLAAPTSLPLPKPDAAPGSDDDLPVELTMRFDPSMTRRLRDAARRHDVTLNTLLQGAWALVLSRYTGEDDVVFGAVRACRHVPVEGAGTIAGMLINTIPMRVRLASAACVDHWLRGLREQWLALRDYEHTPLLHVQRWSGVAGGQPLFDTVFNLHDPDWTASLRRLGGAWSRREFDVRCQPNYPLALDIYADETILVRAFFDPTRFAREGVARLLRHFHNAADALADCRVDTLGGVSVMDPAERRLLVHTFNATHAEYPRATCIHHLFEDHAAASPLRVAVADRHVTLTYDQLNRRANRLAHRLVALGVGPDVPVAVWMDRSAAMLVAWLGALKAGGAFVPFDPDSPVERLGFQLADCQAGVLLTQVDRACRLPVLPERVTCLAIQPNGEGFAGQSDDNPKSAATAENLAYVIYTSGSTGQPKGVQVEHRALGNLVGWHQRAYSVGPGDRATQLANPAFDASVWETWPYLCAGASVHVPDEETRLAPVALWRWMANQQITISFMPTPLAETALTQLWPDGMALRVLLTGGDRLKRPAPANFPCPLVNHYGPTEAAVVATAGVVPPGFAGAPPIGRPISNTTAHVLDRALRLVPVGVTGELYIGGESLARGYHGRPDLTAERFVPVPESLARELRGPAGRDRTFEGSNEAGRQPRLYRTGDLVRWRADGQLEYIGRADFQVKIRGCRVEPGEVEAVLQRQASVREAIVIARSEEGPQRLVGYVVPVPGLQPSPEALIDSLRSTLPAYMVPSDVVILPAWPLTPNGKIDRRALPAPVRRVSQADTDPDPVLTAMEGAVARVWAEVLRRDRVGRHENFFDLGGHSLLAAQASTHLSVALGRAVSVRLVFDFPTVAEFAGELERQGSASPAPRPFIPLANRRSASPELETARPC